MAGRGTRKYYRKDTNRLLTDEEMYTMVMLYSYQRYSVEKIARRFSITPSEARAILGKRLNGSCCG